MSRPNTWMGIPNQPQNKKEQELTRIQANVDGITRSLIEVSHEYEIDFPELDSLSKTYGRILYIYIYIYIY